MHRDDAKKRGRKMGLKSETLRHLQPADLAQVMGGGKGGGAGGGTVGDAPRQTARCFTGV